MAKVTKKNTQENEVEIIANDNVQLVSNDLNTKLKNNLKKKETEVKADLGEVNVVAVEEPKVTPVKMVRILMKENHKCCIGGEWYYLLKDKHYNVPENVKSILLEANKLKPL